MPGAELGPDVRIGPGVSVTIEPGGQLRLGARVGLSAGVEIHVGPGATVTIGDDVFIGRLGVISAKKSIDIGSRTMLAEMVSLRDHDHDTRFAPTDGRFLMESMRVGDDAWIAAKASVVRRGQVGERAVVGAHSLVNRPVPDGAVAVGVPARVLQRD